MNKTQGFYSLIRYSPSLSRGEAVNIGIVLFSNQPPILKHRFLDSAYQRVKSAFGDLAVSRKWFSTLAKSIIKRFSVSQKSSDFSADVMRFSAALANEITISKPKPVFFEDADSIMERMFIDLVAWKSDEQKRELPTIATDSARAFFELPEFAAVVDKQVKEIVPIIDKPVTFDYAYTNGSRQFVKLKQFSKSDACINSALILAHESKIIQEKATPSKKVTIVADFEDNAYARPIKELFIDSSIRVVDVSEINDYLARVSMQVREHLPN